MRVILASFMASKSLTILFEGVSSHNVNICSRHDEEKEAPTLKRGESSCVDRLALTEEIWECFPLGLADSGVRYTLRCENGERDLTPSPATARRYTPPSSHTRC